VHTVQTDRVTYENRIREHKTAIKSGKFSILCCTTNATTFHRNKYPNHDNASKDTKMNVIE